jgi:hypothetical protein
MHILGIRGIEEVKRDVYPLKKRVSALHVKCNTQDKLAES